jgi:hypothetical protein
MDVANTVMKTQVSYKALIFLRIPKLSGFEELPCPTEVALLLRLSECQINTAKLHLAEDYIQLYNE